MSSSHEPPPSIVQGRLIGHFQDRPIDDHGSGWSSLWDSNESDLWDRGRPSPALIDIVEQTPSLFRSVKANGQRKKALVPGCGRGYDVVMLALHGYDTYGLEISASGVTAAKQYAANELEHPREFNFGPGWTGSVTPGNASFIEGDFFSSGWERHVSCNENARFDLIYDYTFLCALHPQMRPQWATRMAQILTHDGLLVCLEFPMYKDPTLPGPPWGLNGVHWDILVRGGDGWTTIANEAEKDAAGRHSGSFKRLLYQKPLRSYENGKGTDMLSVYTLK